ncbi:hypothetical protein GE061_010830 [Apolygus lucorum]|uniref:Uncharacterized protein n=1 Tax=Apolygus lucorum TaxID=248454 RepID=A0A6A4K0Y1_APOLU|nr:hypothetical protein GE061_010830 [Apolygus lucorum]
MGGLILLSIAIFLVSTIWFLRPRKSKRGNQSLTNGLGFLFSWTISNFFASEFNELESPEVPYHTAKWALVLKSSLVGETPKLGLYIKARGLRIPLEIEYKLSMVDVKNERVYNFVQRSSFPAKADWYSGTPEFINTEDIKVQNGLLVDGSVTFLAQIVIVAKATKNFRILDFSDSSSQTMPAETVSETPNEPQDSVILKAVDDLQRDLRILLKNGELSDLKVLVQGREFLVHKAIVAARCPTIASKISDGAFEIVFDDDNLEPDVFGNVLTFIYTGIIDDESLAEKGEKLLKAADILKLEKLKSRAEVALLSSLSPSNATIRLMLAYECNCELMKEPILKMVKQHKKQVQVSPDWESLKNYPEILLDLLNV